MMKKAIYIACAALLVACTPKSAEDAFIDDLLSRMTLEEKIGQLNQLDPSYDTEAKEALIREGRVGAVLNVVGAQEVNRLQRMAVEQTRLGIPLLVGRDVIHGFKTIYPIPLGQGATWNPELVQQIAAQTADETVSAGIRWTFSPMVDVARDPRWGRVAEGYGEDTYLSSQMAAATVRGYQSHDLAACVKHFAGYSASEGGRDYNTTWIPEVQLRDVYLPPFQAAVDAGAMSLMCSFNALNGLPSSANPHLNIDILRNEWHSDALLVSDWGSGADLIPHGLCADRKEAALRCINARMEMDMQGTIYHDYLAELVREHQVTEAQIDDCVRSVLRIKYRLGLFDHPYVPEEETVAYSDEALALATEAVEQGTVLLKNNGILPLNIQHSTFNIKHSRIWSFSRPTERTVRHLGLRCRTRTLRHPLSSTASTLHTFRSCPWAKNSQFSILHTFRSCPWAKNSQFSILNSQLSLSPVSNSAAIPPPPALHKRWLRLAARMSFSSLPVRKPSCPVKHVAVPTSRCPVHRHVC